MPKRCAHCGTENQDQAKFCRQCGQFWDQPWLSPVVHHLPVTQQWRQLKCRMTRKEVRSILGEPARISAAPSGSPGSELWSYAYEHSGPQAAPLTGTVEFALPDGTVAAWTEPDWSQAGQAAPD